MKNLQKYLERYAEWVALALGAIYVLYVVYSNVVTPPITTMLPSGKVVTPGQVDQETLDKPGHQLETAVARTDMPEMKVEAFAAHFKDVIEGKQETAVALASPPMFFPPIGPDFGPGGPVEDLTKMPVGQATIPEPPAAQAWGVVAGLSTLSIPNANNPQPKATNVVPAGNPEDVEWVTAFFKVPKDEFAKAFQDSNIPDVLRKTSFLEVTLTRQTLQPNGTWADDTVIPALTNQNLPEYPGQNDLQSQLMYKDWAEKNAAAIIQPVFYQVLGGDPWHVPGETVQAAQMAVLPKEEVKRPFDPAKGIPKTPEERKQKADYEKQQREKRAAAAKAKADAAKSKETPTPAPARRQPTPPGAGGKNYAPRDTDRPTNPGGARPPAPIRQPAAPMTAPPGVPARFQPQPAGAKASNAAKTGSSVMGVFDPTQIDEDIVVWAHDTSVESGRTYRYKISYKIRNPLFQTRNIAKDQQDASKFDVQSKDSEWTDPVTIRPRTVFYLASGVSPSTGRVRIDVFKWAKGKQTMRTFEVGPGDVVGIDPNGNDEFATGWTIVDFRHDYRMDDQAVILVDDNQNLLKRSRKQDEKNEQYNQLKTQVSSAAESGAVAGRP